MLYVPIPLLELGHAGKKPSAEVGTRILAVGGLVIGWVMRDFGDEV